MRDRGPIVGKHLALAHDLAACRCHARPNHTSPTGFSTLPPPGPATPVTDTSDVGVRTLQRARGHLLRHRFADRADRADQLGRHAEKFGLGLRSSR